MTDVELQVSRLIVESAGLAFPEKSILALIVYVIGIPIVARQVWYSDTSRPSRGACVLSALLWPVYLVGIPYIIAALGLQFLTWAILPAEEDRP